MRLLLTLLALMAVGVAARAHSTHRHSHSKHHVHKHSGDSATALAAELAHLERTAQQRGDDAALIIDTLVNGDYKGLTWDRLANFTDTSELHSSRSGAQRERMSAQWSAVFIRIALTSVPASRPVASVCSRSRPSRVRQSRARRRRAIHVGSFDGGRFR